MLQGALVANYPWDANDPGETGYAGAPDDATFRCICICIHTFSTLSFHAVHLKPHSMPCCRDKRENTHITQSCQLV